MKVYMSWQTVRTIVENISVDRERMGFYTYTSGGDSIYILEAFMVPSESNRSMVRGPVLSIPEKHRDEGIPGVPRRLILRAADQLCTAAVKMAMGLNLGVWHTHTGSPYPSPGDKPPCLIGGFLRHRLFRMRAVAVYLKKPFSLHVLNREYSSIAFQKGHVAITSLPPGGKAGFRLLSTVKKCYRRVTGTS